MQKKFLNFFKKSLDITPLSAYNIDIDRGNTPHPKGKRKMTYEIRKANIEIRLTKWVPQVTQSDIFDAYNESVDQDYIVIGEFETLQEAQAAFEKEKADCFTTSTFSVVHTIIADILFLVETNENEDVWDSFAKSIVFEKNEDDD